jgi:alginate O-acetyltransferase complex protein AlgI
MNWIPVYLGLILGLTVINYGFGLLLGRDRRRGWLALAVVTNLGVLAYFKYANFFLDSGRSLGLDWPTQNILLPLGISFFSFEFIHYTVDVWRGSPPVRNFVQFALFAAFFPTQIAGPIKRYQAFVHQLREYPAFNAALAGEGVYLILRGLFKKVVLADNLARIANLGFDHAPDLGSLDTWFAVYAFAFQIFFDFSGYTDIGRGSAQLFGFTVPENFEAPYLSRNLSDFWRRWHISLSSWLRDYLFIPLGGSRVSRARTYLNLFLTMTLGGLWHGAAWHFLLWGAFQGAGLAALRWMGEVRKQRLAAPALPAATDPMEPGEPPRHTSDEALQAAPPQPQTRFRLSHAALGWVFGIVATFHFTCISWVLFRAPDLDTIRIMLTRLLTPMAGKGDIFATNDYWTVLGVMLAYFGGVGGATWLRGVLPPARWERLVAWQWAVRPVAYAAMVVWIILFPAAAQRFLYFQF